MYYFRIKCIFAFQNSNQDTMHSKKTGLYRHLAILFFILYPIGELIAQDEATTYKIDSVLYKYYQKCKENIKNHTVLAMSDTLFQMAGEKGDQRMQAVALSTKVDYFYFGGINEDSLLTYVDKVKKFSKKTKQPKYYYFIWGKRHILHYIKQGKNNLALFEADKMLKEAKAEDYKEGVATCYNCLSNIYILKGFPAQAMQYQLKELELYEKYQLENYNIALLYATVAEQYTVMNQMDKAEEMFKKAEEKATIDGQATRIKLKRVAYYLKIGDTSTAWKLLQECRKAIAADKSFNPFMNSFYEAELKYYNVTCQYTKALTTIELLGTFSQGTSANINKLLQKGHIYWDLNQKNEAAKCYREYIQGEKKMKAENEEITTGEFATLLNVQQLNAEKSEIMHQAQEKQLEYNRTTIILLITLLVIALIFSYREKLLNKKLKSSKDELLQKNQILEKSQKDLSEAKEVAEQASRMKTSFIQNMSHEIRTPLNSIVGFSQVLTHYFSEDEEAREFSDIIEKNSSLLLKLITDVLYLSSLDQMEKPMDTVATNINDCCLLSTELTLPQIKEGVLLLFTPTYETLLVQTNPEQVSQILTNLLSNAAKFTTDGEISLTYAISEATQTLIFNITDTGVGIPVEQQERVFERFFKLNDFEQGCGLGLPISRMIAERLGGSLIIDSNYKNGSRFVLTLPYIPA